MSLRPILACLLVLLTLTGPAAARSLGAEIDAVVLEQYPQPGPGCAVAVVKDGKIAHLKGYGLADVRSRKPITPDSVFDLASCSKQFTATCVLLLADRGKLRLDDDARRFLPELKERPSPVRVANLLGMTSGLPEYEVDTPGTSPEDVLRQVADERLKFGAGKKYEYVNTNYALLTLMVERLTGMSQRQFLRQEVFGPLGMKASDFLEEDGYRAPGQVRGYALNDKGRAVLSENPVTGLGDGNVVSSARDMATWLLALRKQALLKPGTWKRAWTEGTLADGKRTGYGFGWEISRNPLCVSHSGSWYGTATYMEWYPEEDFGIVVLSNLEDSGVTDVAEGVGALFRR